MYLLKMSGPQIWLCLLTFRPIASKQLNGLTTIDILSWLGGAVVTHPLWVQEVPQGFLCLIFCIVVVVFLLFLSKNTLFIAKYCNSFYNVNFFSILNVLQDLWPIIRVKRYRPSIFNMAQNKMLKITPTRWQSPRPLMSRPGTATGLSWRLTG